MMLVVAPWFVSGLGDYLPTSYLLIYAHGEFQELPDTRGGGRVASTNVGPDLILVQRAGHALFALLFGFIGGVTAKWFYLTRSPPENEGRPQK
jgi:hypothetical protein